MGDLLNLPSQDHFLDATSVHPSGLPLKPSILLTSSSFTFAPGHIRAQHIAKVERVLTVAVEIRPHLRTHCGEPVHHRAISQHGQVEAVPVEGDELRTQLTDFLNEVAYQFSFRALANVGRAERLDTPTFSLAARNESANASEFMDRRVVFIDNIRGAGLT
jgi:hypothetical protein